MRDRSKDDEEEGNFKEMIMDGEQNSVDSVQPFTERKYCFACGQECKIIEMGEFSVQTGKRKLRYQCPSDLCLHLGIDHAPLIKVRGFWAALCGARQCPRCGVRYEEC